MVFFISLLGACNPSRKVAEGDFLLTKNTINVYPPKSISEKKALKDVLHKDNFKAIVKQKPNYKILGIFKFHLGVHNAIDTTRMRVDMQEKKSKLIEKNAQREAKGNKAKKYKKPIRQWLYEDVGEPPEIFDSSLATKSIDEFKNYLFNKGFFDPEISFTTRYDSLQRRVQVAYAIQSGKPHRIKYFQNSITDPEINDIVNTELQRDSIVRSGDRLDFDVLKKYQTKLSLVLKSKGYYRFTRDLIQFEVDTNLASHSAILYLYIDRNYAGYDKPDSLVSQQFKKFRVTEITYNTSSPPYKDKSGDALPYDSVTYNGLNIMYQYKLNFKPRLLDRNLLFSKDSLYNADLSNLTYRKLYALGVFDIVNIQYEPLEKSDTSSKEIPLKASINLKATKNQGVMFEGSMTNNGGNLGVQGSVIYTHRNIFKGAEHLVLSLSGGVESQWAIGTPEESAAIFNTLEFAPSLELTIPRFIFPFSERLSQKIQNPQTFFSFDFRYQRRPDYTGIINTGYFGYRWSPSKTLSHRLNVLQISQVNIDKSQVFKEYIETLNNAVIEAIYDDHFIPSSRYTLTYNSQVKQSQKNVIYTQFNFQEAGNITSLIARAVNAPTNENGKYEIGRVPFAQFLKAEIDFRNYNYINAKNTVAYRINLGAGIPYGNLDVIPFNEAFFVGGSNSNRGWRPRTLGPGSYFDSTGVETYDKVGDIKLDLSLEYRFNLVSLFDMAFFLDAGNLWFMPRSGFEKDNPAVFNISRFFSEIAFTFGTGLRLNFNFFIIRFDFGLQIKDPKVLEGERWIFQSKTKYNQMIDDINQYKLNNPELYPDPVFLPYYRPTVIFNLAIGYPF
jgi:outer membrane protein assembly factor BamA